MISARTCQITEPQMISWEVMRTREERLSIRRGSPLSQDDKGRIARGMCNDVNEPPTIVSTLEDTPFYARSLLRTTLLGEEVTAMHESLDIPRLVSLPVRLMLPWRMPRRA